MVDDDITIVTGLFNIGRDELTNGFGRDFKHYLNKFQELLKVDCPMVVFCEQSLNDFIWKYRKPSNTRIVNKSLEGLRREGFFPKIQQIRNNPKWKKLAGWLNDSPQSSLEMYNPIVMSKQFWLHDASLYNYFDTRYFLWLDAGITNTVNIPEYFKNINIIKHLKKCMNKMLYISFPYQTDNEIHGFVKSAINRYAEDDVTRVVRGGCFGGTKEAITAINEVYYHTLHNTLSAGYMGTEESVFSILSYTHPHLIHLEMINADGLINTFFERLKMLPNKTANDKVSLYVLTYNTPKQFQLWIESFKIAYPDAYSKFDKFVLNNSDEPTTQHEYRKLFKLHGFTELPFNNIGITEGRYEIARHFHNTANEYMIFFEDDMMLNASKHKETKSGFASYFDKETLFKIKEIIDQEDLDYIKLSFDEVYGDNSLNWAWHHTSPELKKEMFGTEPPYSKIQHISSYRNIPYAVGEYFYCNWPIMFNKVGNKKIFIDNEIIHKHEGAYMYRSLELFKAKTLKSACLLGSIIKHNRQYDYERSKRKENKGG